MAVKVLELRQDDTRYPVGLRQPLAADIKSLAIAGNVDLLAYKAVGIFCSIKCPGDLILKTYDLARALRDAGRMVIGGFHSPMEKECLPLLLRGEQPVIVCLARGLENLRLPATWKTAIADGRLLLVSPFDSRCRRVTGETAEKRNRCIMAMADDVIVTYAHAGGRLEQLCREAVAAGKMLWTIDDPSNTSLIQFGAQPLAVGALPAAWAGKPNGSPTREESQT